MTLAVRLDYDNWAELDYYLFPWLDLPQEEIRLSNRNSFALEPFRFDDLSFFLGMTERVGILRGGSDCVPRIGSPKDKP